MIIFDFIWSIVVVWLILSMKSLPPFDLTWLLDKKQEIKDKPKHYMIYLRVYSRLEKKYSQLTTRVVANQELFDSATSKKPKSERALEVSLILEKIMDNVKQYNSSSQAQTLEQFKSLIKSKKGSVKVLDGYDNLIKWYIELKRFGSAESCTYSKKKIAEFTDIEKLTYHDITVKWLQRFEAYCTENDISVSTVGFYLRQLRKVLNEAIKNVGINYTKDDYPFGSDKFTIKISSGRYAALDDDQLKRFYDWTPTKENLGLAKDFFFFSYLANGLNPADVLNIKHSDIIDGRKFNVIREKTKNSNKIEKPITIHLNAPLMGILKRRAGKGKYLWDYYNDTDTWDDKKRRRGYYVKRINVLLKEIAVILDLPEKISTTWARHSMATSSIRKGSSMEAVSEAMGHSSTRVTKGYFAGFEDSVQKEHQQRLTEF